ncbi:1304_t:CDS:2 [Gigaspora margarita]|uniref:1304_t:CDS:1 n=1 Tax=Gigaspora margarita TaxID=4874 RepID=A0ABM8VZK3_GIGMA|nr:1304_t:CDS:2 [Gigaspora margarita]
MSFSHINSPEPFDSYIQPIIIESLHFDAVFIQEHEELVYDTSSYIIINHSRLSEKSFPQPLTLQSFSECSSEISNDISNDTSVDKCNEGETKILIDIYL